MKMKPIPSRDVLSKYLIYDKDTGILVRRKDGSVADNNIDSRGYRDVCVEKERYAAHRVAWVLAHGTNIGRFQIDHIDGDPSNNAIRNLRLATSYQNAHNAVKPLGSSGVRDVVWNSEKGKWMVRVGAYGKTYQRGYFSNIEDAKTVAEQTVAELHGSFAMTPRVKSFGAILADLRREALNAAFSLSEKERIKSLIRERAKSTGVPFDEHDVEEASGYGCLEWRSASVGWRVRKRVRGVRVSAGCHKSLRDACNAAFVLEQFS